MESAQSAALRARIFEVVAERIPSGEVVDRHTLLTFEVDGVKIPLIDYSRGIRNPRQLQATLSIVSSADGPYGDTFIEAGVWRYDFRSGGPGGDNAKLAEAHRVGAPLLMFRKLKPNVYQAIYPVWVAQVHEREQYVEITFDDLIDITGHTASAIERRYAQAIAKRRIHQPAFRALVLRAYETRCTVCRLAHAELLDAAHIAADAAGGDAHVTNGMTMCKIHHAAYDQNFLGITPDYEIRINERLLQEKDGPMLKHGLQEMHGLQITLPRVATERPDRDRLDARFTTFSQA